MSLIRSCMCDICGKSESFGDQNWARPIGWSSCVLETRTEKGSQVDILKMDLCPQCRSRMGAWTEDRVGA